MHFSRQMAVFVHAGIPLLETLDVMTEELGNKEFAVILAEMADALPVAPPSPAQQRNTQRRFPSYYIGILRSAEITGSLDTVLDQLADYIERDIEARRKVSSALMYPAIVFCLAIVAVVVITAFVLPKFKTFFTSLTAKLPLPTRMLLGVANFFGNDWYVVVGFVGLVVLLVLLGQFTTSGRRKRDALMLKMPVLGDLISTAIVERVCRILHSLVMAGVPLPEALQVTTDTTTNWVYRSGLAEARAAMMRGEGLAGPLSATGLFPLLPAICSPSESEPARWTISWKRPRVFRSRTRLQAE